MKNYKDLGIIIETTCYEDYFNVRYKDSMFILFSGTEKQVKGLLREMLK